MLKENSKTSSADVIPAIVNFIDNVNQEGYLPDLPAEMQSICDLFLETDQANDKHVREKMLRCLNAIRGLASAMQPFSTIEVSTAVNSFQNV